MKIFAIFLLLSFAVLAEENDYMDVWQEPPFIPKKQTEHSRADLSSPGINMVENLCTEYDFSKQTFDFLITYSDDQNQMLSVIINLLSEPHIINKISLHFPNYLSERFSVHMPVEAPKYSKIRIEGKRRIKKSQLRIVIYESDRDTQEYTCLLIKIQDLIKMHNKSKHRTR